MYVKTSDQEVIDLGFCDLQCNNGMHFAGLYETDAERDEIIMGFMGQGIIYGDINLYCPTEQTAGEFTEKFCRLNPELCGCVRDGSCISFSTVESLYYSDGQFCPDTMDRMLTEFWIKSQENGKRNVRASAEMVWALEKSPGLIKLMAYESRLNYFIPGKPWVSICLYNATKFDGATIMQVLRTHPYTISKGGIITENPFYLEPDIWFDQYAPQYKPS